MPWSDIPTVLKQLFGYFGPDQHEQRVLRKFVGCWDKLRPYINPSDKKEKYYVNRMDKLRKELR